MQHSGIGGFGNWGGVLILYHSLITKMVYCAAIIEILTLCKNQVCTPHRSRVTYNLNSYILLCTVKCTVSDKYHAYLRSYI